jgi:hypothetical protein
MIGKSTPMPIAFVPWPFLQKTAHGPFCSPHGNYMQPEAIRQIEWNHRGCRFPVTKSCLVLGAASPVHRVGMRARSNSTLALPYMARFNVFSLLI